MVVRLIQNEVGCRSGEGWEGVMEGHGNGVH